MEHLLGSQVSWGTEPQLLGRRSREGSASGFQLLPLFLSAHPSPFDDLLFAGIVLTVAAIEGGGAGTEGPQHTGAPIQTARSV